MTNTVAFAFCMICSYIYIVFNAHTWKTQLKTEHVSEAERCDAQLNIPLLWACVPLRSPAKTVRTF